MNSNKLSRLIIWFLEYWTAQVQLKNGVMSFNAEVDLKNAIPKALDLLENKSDS